MQLISVDVEADGPIPPLYSMVSFGAVIVDEKLDKTFYRMVKPISKHWLSESLKFTNSSSREEHEKLGVEPTEAMKDFALWLSENVKGHPVFISDNPAFDWQWINFYFHKYYGKNPFGFSARRIGDLYCGMEKKLGAKWKHLRITKHTHNPVDDAKGNAEVILLMKKNGLK